MTVRCLFLSGTLSARPRGGRGIFLRGRLTVKKRVHYRVIALRSTFHVDTQRVRKKTIQRLEEIFKSAFCETRKKVGGGGYALMPKISANKMFMSCIVHCRRMF
jgi:hypothetical protein